MIRSLRPWHSRAVAAGALAAAAALVVAGCGGAGSSGSSPPSGTASKPASTHTSSSTGSTSAVSSNSVPWPIAIGDTWTYSSTNNAVTGGTVVDKIAAVTAVAAGQQVTMDGSITTAGGTTNHSAYYVFHPDGSITYPWSQFSSGSSTSSVRLLSGQLIWPSESALAAGQVSHGTLQIQYSTNGQTRTVTADITVKGGGTQSVTVPFGSYTATVVEMIMNETVQGIPISDTVTTWLAPHVGPVKTQAVLGEDGHSTVVVTQVLTSFTQG
jgi:DUF3108-like